MSEYKIIIPALSELTGDSVNTELMKNFNTTIDSVLEEKSFREYVRMVLNLFISKKMSNEIVNEITDCISRTLIENSQLPEDLSIMYFASPDIVMSLSITLKISSTLKISKNDLISILIKNIQEKCNLNESHINQVRTLLGEIIT